MEKLMAETTDYIKGLFYRRFDWIEDFRQTLRELDEEYRSEIEPSIRFCEFKGAEGAASGNYSDLANSIRFCEFKDAEEPDAEVQGCREAVAEFEQRIRAVCESIKLPESLCCKGTEPGDIVDACFTQLALLEDELRAAYTDFYWKAVRADE